MEPSSPSVYCRYSRDERFQDWEKSFKRQTKDTLEKLLNPQRDHEPSSAADRIRVNLKKIASEVEELERIVQNYGSQHKIPIYYNVLERKVKLFIRLDRVDVANFPEFYDERRALHLRLPQLLQNLEQRIHSSNANCADCTNRDIVA